MLILAAGLLWASQHLKVAPEPSAIRDTTVWGVALKGETISVVLADTEALRKKGLSGRESLAQDEGMLFIFPEDGKYAFWMRDMRFPIDILWLSDTGAVVYMVQNVSPETYPENFAPYDPARYVLELPTGWAREHNVQIGDIVRF
jgi:hypothetical protein